VDDDIPFFDSLDINRQYRLTFLDFAKALPEKANPKIHIPIRHAMGPVL